MGRVISKTITQRAADIDAFVTEDTDVTGPFPLALTLDGTLASTPNDGGGARIDLSDGLAVLVAFSTGTTGSVADATVVGKDQFGQPLTEVVTLPGADGDASTVEAFSYIESITVDAVFTELSVGIITTDDQFSVWHAWNTGIQEFNATVSVVKVSGTLDLDLEHTVQERFLLDGPEPDNSFDDTGMASVSADAQVQIAQPVTASRIRVNAASSSAVFKVKYLQTGY